MVLGSSTKPAETYGKQIVNIVPLVKCQRNTHHCIGKELFRDEDRKLRVCFSQVVELLDNWVRWVHLKLWLQNCEPLFLTEVSTLQTSRKIERLGDDTVLEPYLCFNEMPGSGHLLHSDNAGVRF